MSKSRPPRRLVDFGTIDVRRTVAAPASIKARLGWSCRVFKARRSADVARGADLWSSTERAEIARMMGVAA